MAYLLLCFLLCLLTQSHAADTHENRWKEKPVTLKFPDDENKNLTVIAGTITSWSTTIKLLLDDLGAELPVPVHNVHKQVVKCLAHLAIEKKDPLTSFNFSRPVDEIKESFALKLNDIKYQCLSRKQLLLQANYLDVSEPFKNILAYFYATTLKTKIPKISQQIASPQVNVYFDDLPHELEPLIAQWLLYNLVRDKPIETTKHKALSMNTDSLIHGPFISHASAPRGFACTWSEMDGGIHLLPMRMQLNRLQYLDFYDETKCEKWDISPTDINQYTHCATSPDARYILMVVKENGIYSSLYLLDQVTLYARRTAFYHKAEGVQSILYNEHSKTFNIIVHKKIEHRAHTEALYVYNLNPTQTNLTVEELAMFKTDQSPMLQDSDLMDWSCIQGSLVGIHAPKSEKITALLYTNKQLFECHYDAHKELWTYTTNSAQEQIAHFTVVHIGGMVTSKNNNAMAIERSCIPSFEQIIQERLPNMDTQQGNSWVMHFDPNHLCYNYLKKSNNDSNTVIAKTKYLFSPTVTAAMQYINRKILEGEKRVLIDTYALYHHVMNPHTRDKYCSSLSQYLSPEITKIFEIKL